MPWLQVLDTTLEPPTLHLRAVEGEAEERFTELTTAETASKIYALARERPFIKNLDKPYELWILGVQESNHSPVKNLLLEIRRGKSRAKRATQIEKPLFLKLWNVYHSKCMPSQLQDGQHKTLLRTQ